MLANVKSLTLTIQPIPTETKSRKRKKNVLHWTKFKYYKEILDFSNIEYYIFFFLITQISGQHHHVDDSLRTRVLFRTQFCETGILKKWYLAICSTEFHCQSHY